MKKLFIIILSGLILLGGASFASQPGGHVFFGKIAWNLTDSFCQQNNLVWAKPVAKPLAAFLSHLPADKFIGESALGDWQVYIGITRVTIGYFVTDDKDKGDYLQYAFWSLLPDIGQKMFGWQWIHPEIPGPKIFNLDRDQNELAEELFLANLIFKFEVKF